MIIIYLLFVLNSLTVCDSWTEILTVEFKIKKTKHIEKRNIFIFYFELKTKILGLSFYTYANKLWNIHEKQFLLNKTLFSNPSAGNLILCFIVGNKSIYI